ncbi:MAG: DNA polymerase IV [Acidimicrobiia bacterium]|nr:DNA polymerase IV [Acidimicrobiia bacterium]
MGSDATPTGRRPRIGSGPPPDGTAGFLHVDMDAFYAAVEIRRRPELGGRPVVVGASGPRGVVAAASYEARAYGIHSAMPGARAARLCPHAVFLPGDHRHYAEVSGRIMTILRAVTPYVEPLSLDEAFLDVRGARRLLGDPVAIAWAVRRRIHDEEGLTASIGVAPVKFLAKLASVRAKPRATPLGPTPGRGVTVVEPGQELAFLHPLAVTALWGVGPATHGVLERYGVRTVGDLAVLGEDTLRRALGRAGGLHLHRLANGLDDRPVVADAAVKSVSHEETFARDLTTPEEVRTECVRLADAVGVRLREAGVAGRTVTVKVRFHDFRTITRSVTLSGPADSGTAIARAAKALLEAVDPASGVRLLGVGVSKLVEGASVQLSLDELVAADPARPVAPGATPADARRRSWDDATRAVDAIRGRFGRGAIAPATVTGRKAKERGDQQWGPGSDRNAGGEGGATTPGPGAPSALS